MGIVNDKKLLVLSGGAYHFFFDRLEREVTDMSAKIDIILRRITGMGQDNA
jgi:hypothetical protein